MDTSKLKKFAQATRQELLEQIGSKLAFVLKMESPARREYPAVVNELEKAISAQGKAGLIDQVAYTWFNRFCALRFMDVNGYNRVGVVSPAEGQVQPEILAEAKSGVIDDTQINPRTAEQIRGLLNGTISSQDAQSEAYRLLIVGSCNALYDRMPYMFERIQDFTELLMPDDLLSDNSILTKMRTVMTTESCQDVEIIGWLYQFYISQKKDAVFAGLKNNQKITAENIPAATQLFTPHWIVRYLVENSLGRLWMLNRPNSKLTELMEYYIAPEEPETDFLKISHPEELRIADPAAGSGHMLTYAFDLLYAIYEEERYDPNDIPGLILRNNLYGIEIDERAGALASFALEMKAAEKLGRRRFFKMNAKPNVCVLDDVSFSESEIDDVITIVGKDIFTADLRKTLTQFRQSKNFGSLIIPKLKDPAETARLIEAKDFSGDLLLSEVYGRLVKVLRMAEFLSPKYHVVVANPPYMNAKGMDEQTKKFAESNYKSVKSNLFSMFMNRILGIVIPKGEIGLMTPISWMSLSSFEALRLFLLEKSTITSFVQPEYNAFWDSAHVAICAFTLNLKPNDNYIGTYLNLAGFYGADLQPKKVLEGVKDRSCSYRYLATGASFKMIPGSPIAYWINKVENFKNRKIGDLFVSGGRNKTHNNEKYLRYVWEISKNSSDWIPYANGGNFRKYSGNDLELIDWSEEARAFYESHGGLSNSKYWGKEGITWSLVTSAITGFRIKYDKEQYSSGSPTIFNKNFDCDFILLGFLNSPVANYYLKAITPTVNTTVNDVFALPYLEIDWPSSVTSNVQSVISISRKDWENFETSLDFRSHPFFYYCTGNCLVQEVYVRNRSDWRNMTLTMQSLEENSNQIFINAYGLNEELDSSLPPNEVTLFCNPKYRYDNSNDEEQLEALLLADTVAEFLSYAVGCMFGRYSLNEPGLILANHGETLADYLARIPDPTFIPDDNNVIPMIEFEGDWFEDDISERFKQFLRVTFGDEHYRENLAFIEDALGKSIQKYFVKDFYNDHVKCYKKRPIYWLFSSPKGTFNALIYMHRYTPSTVSVVLNEYLREFRTKLEARRDSYEQISISASSSQQEKTQALKMIDKINKTIAEVNDYEREVLYPLASQNIAIDLDDGVKHNYPLFGTALKKIVGLS